VPGTTSTSWESASLLVTWLAAVLPPVGTRPLHHDPDQSKDQVWPAQAPASASPDVRKRASSGQRIWWRAERTNGNTARA
jgi:hypothetical protein